MSIAKIRSAALASVIGLLLAIGAIAAAAPSQAAYADDTGVGVYRLYNKATGEHLWTTDTNEYKVLATQHGWTAEGGKWLAPSEGQGVYRLYNPSLGDHHYTSDTNEVKVLTTQYGWRYDYNAKPMFFSAADVKGQPFPGATAIYRLYNKDLRVGQHLLTMDKNEYNVIPKYGWKQEGVKLYALSGDASKVPYIAIPTAAPSKAPATNASNASTASDAKYTLNSNTMKFHYTSCAWVKEIAAAHRIYSNETRQAIINKGYVACLVCKP